MIPEREREALMRLTMCARDECSMCKYKGTCNSDFQYELATKSMNILADALRKDESQTDWKDQMWAEAVEQREHDILYEPTYDLDDGSM